MTTDTIRVPITFPRDMAVELQTRAIAADVSVDVLVREAVRRWLAERPISPVRLSETVRNASR